MVVNTRVGSTVDRCTTTWVAPSAASASWLRSRTVCTRLGFGMQNSIASTIAGISQFTVRPFLRENVFPSGGDGSRILDATNRVLSNHAGSPLDDSKHWLSSGDSRLQLWQSVSENLYSYIYDPMFSSSVVWPRLGGVRTGTGGGSLVTRGNPRTR